VRGEKTKKKYTATVQGVREVSPEKEKRRLRWKGFVEKVSFKPEVIE